VETIAGSIENGQCNFGCIDWETEAFQDRTKSSHTAKADRPSKQPVRQAAEIHSAEMSTQAKAWWWFTGASSNAWRMAQIPAHRIRKPPVLKFRSGRVAGGLRLSVHPFALYPRINASRSAFTLSLSVEHIPCGAPGYTFSVAPFTSATDSSAEALIGTI